MSTRRPTSEPSWRSARNAVTPATGMAAAMPRSTPSGTIAISAVSTDRCSAHAPDQPNVTTRVPDRRTGAVGRRCDHHPRGIEPGHGAGSLTVLQEGDICEVERHRRHPDPRLRRAWVWFRHLSQLETVVSIGVIDQGTHRRSHSRRSLGGR